MFWLSKRESETFHLKIHSFAWVKWYKVRESNRRRHQRRSLSSYVWACSSLYEEEGISGSSTQVRNLTVPYFWSKYQIALLLFLWRSPEIHFFQLPILMEKVSAEWLKCLCQTRGQLQAQLWWSHRLRSQRDACENSHLVHLQVLLSILAWAQLVLEML